MVATEPVERDLRIAVMCESVQLSDITACDIFGNMQQDLIEKIIKDDVSGPMAQAMSPFKDHTLKITWFYPATTMDPAFMTPAVRFLPTVTYDDCPRDLDILVIGGPLLDHRPPQADRFMKELWEKTPVVLSTCVGSMWLASSGVMNGLEATTNRMFLDVAKAMHPEVKWKDQRWVVQEKPYSGSKNGGKGELWTAGGAGCGRLFSIQKLSDFSDFRHRNRDDCDVCPPEMEPRLRSTCRASRIGFRSQRKPRSVLQ